jgi:hypothetical protein
MALRLALLKKLVLCAGKIPEYNFKNQAELTQK